MRSVYASKIDTWLLMVLVLAMAIALFSAFKMFTQSGVSAWPILGLLLVLGVGLPGWVLLGTNYRVESDRLLVRSGPFRWSVALADIQAIVPTRNAVSSPALSLDRLEIRRNGASSVLVSPRDKDRFVEDIKAKQRAR